VQHEGRTPPRKRPNSMLGQLQREKPSVTDLHFFCWQATFSFFTVVEKHFYNCGTYVLRL